MKKMMKLTMITVSLLCLLSLMAFPAYAFDKAEMDVALREELAKIPDLETRQAILDEYKEVIREKLPELNLDEATCQSCEEDIKTLEKEQLASLGKENVDPAKFSGGREKLLEKQKNYKTVTELEYRTEYVPRFKWVQADGSPIPEGQCACGYDGAKQVEDGTKPITTPVEVPKEVETGESVVPAQAQ